MLYNLHFFIGLFILNKLSRSVTVDNLRALRVQNFVWSMKLCFLLDYRRFGGVYYLHIQDSDR